MEKLKEMRPGQSCKLMLLALVLMATQFFANAAAIQAKHSPAGLIIKIEGLKNSKGSVRVAVFKGADGFPGDRQKAIKVLSVPAEKGGVQLVLNELEDGKYAVAILHDENENGEMDTNFLGYPQEGYGASNNNLPVFRAPTFDEAAFDLKGSAQELLIRVRN